MRPLMDYIKQPYRVVMGLSRYHILNWMPDELYLKIVYCMVFKKPLDLQNPRTYNEKLQWMKLYNRDPRYTMMVDKCAVKKYIAEKIGSDYVIPTLGVWESVNDIDFSQLPEQFVLKCNHDSGGVVICRDRESFDYGAASKKLSRCLRQNGYWYGREWPYKNIPPRIIAEPYLEDPKKKDLFDYKFYVFSGRVRAMYIATEHYGDDGLKLDFFDADFNHLNIHVKKHTNSSKKIEKPKSFEKMKNLAEIIADDLPAARVDFYEIDGQVYFGEITFFDASGFEPFEPSHWDSVFGDWLKLPTGE